MPLTDEEIQAQQKAIAFNRNMRGKNRPPTPTTPQQGLDSVLQNGNLTFKYSESGSGGSLLAIPNGPGEQGAAIKLEHWYSVNKAQKVGQFMDQFFQNAGGTPPFLAPRTRVYSEQDLVNNPQITQGLLGHLTREEQAATDKARKRGLGEQTQALTEIGNGQETEKSVLVMEFAPGKQMDKLSTDEKIALIKTEAFAYNIGRALAPTVALGLTDHLGAYNSGFAVNPTNLMYDPGSGTLSMIDFDTKDGRHPSGDHCLDRVGGPETANSMKKLREFLEKATASQQDFDEALENLLKVKDVHPKGGEYLPSGTITPLFDVVDGFCRGQIDGFFSKKERDALKQLTPEDRRQFAINLMAGVIDGMEYVQKNQQALQTAIGNVRENINGTQVDHFYTDAEFQKLSAEMNQLNPDDLRVKLAKFSKANILAYQQSRLDEAAKQMQPTFDDLDKKETKAKQKLADVNAKIAQIEIHPSFKDKIKEALTTKNHHPIDKLRSQQLALTKELTLIGNLRNDAVASLQDIQGNIKARNDFHNNMNEVESQVKPPKVTAPKQGQGQKTGSPKVGTKDKVAPKKPQADLRNESGVRAKPRTLDQPLNPGKSTLPKVEDLPKQQEAQKKMDDALVSRRAKPRQNDSPPDSNQPTFPKVEDLQTQKTKAGNTPKVPTVEEALEAEKTNRRTRKPRVGEGTTTVKQEAPELGEGLKTSRSKRSLSVR